MIQITADTRRAVVTNKELLTVGSAGIQVQFTLSEDWAGLSKLAVFRVGDEGEKVDVVLDSELTCVVPPEVLTDVDEVLFIGVYGSNGEGTIIIPTVWASAGVVKPGTSPNTPASAEPTPEIWAQILSVAQDAEQTATDAMSIVEDAVAHTPIIQDGYWYFWNEEAQEYQSTGIKAEGTDGYSPDVTIADITGGHSVTITDEDHPQGQAFNVMDGTDGEDGEDGDDGYSPAVTITEITDGHRVTITDETHPSGQTFDVMDGTGSVDDVLINGMSIVNDGIADIPIASGDTPGIIKIASDGSNGIGRWSTGSVYVNSATVAQIKTGTEGYRPIVPGKQNASVFYGLAKAAGDDTQSASSNPVGTYTDGAKAAIKDMIGATAGGIEFDETATYPSGSVGAALTSQLNAISQLEDGVQDLAPVVPNTDSGDIVFISDGAGDRQIQKIVGTIKTDAGSSGWTQAKVWQQTGNLFDKNALKRGYALDNHGNEIANSNFGVTGLIRVGLNAGDHIKVKYITGSGTQWTFRCIGYKENGDYDREVFNVTITSGSEARDITLSSGVYYVRLSVGIINRQNLDVLQFKCDKNVLTIPFGTTVSNGTVTLNADKSADVVDSDSGTSYHLPDVGSVNTLHGTNNMWVDCGSITEIQYQADTKLYVDASKSCLIDNYLNKGRMQFCAHRGARTEAPENSIPAFEIAGQNGFDWLNLAQLRQSADGTWYVMHDATVDRTTDGTGNIKDLTDAYLSTLHIDTGAHVSDFTPAELVIPTLEDAIKIARKYGMKLYFRIGAVPSDWTSFLTIIRKYRCEGMLFGSNSLAEIMPLAELGYCVNWDVYNATDAEYQIVSYINSGIKNATLFVSASVITDTLVQLARSNGYKVMAFDPSDTSVTLTKAQAQQLSDMGVDVVSAPVKFNLAE